MWSSAFENLQQVVIDGGELKISHPAFVEMVINLWTKGFQHAVWRASSERSRLDGGLFGGGFEHYQASQEARKTRQVQEHFASGACLKHVELKRFSITSGGTAGTAADLMGFVSLLQEALRHAADATKQEELLKYILHECGSVRNLVEQSSVDPQLMNVAK